MPKLKTNSLATTVDLLYRTRQARLDLQKQVTELEEIEATCKERLILELPKEAATGVAGRFARASLVTKSVPQVSDWEAVYKYVKKTGEFDLLQRRLSNEAVVERWEAGKELPGVKRFPVVTVSVNKV